MTTHNYIDPGTTKGSALAAFNRPDVGQDGRPQACVSSARTELVSVAFIHYNPESGECMVKKHWGAPLASGPTLWEKPQIYPTMMKRKAQEIIAHANDCVDLSEHGRAAASFMAYGCGVKAVLPRVWKKQVPKPQHHRKAWLVLTEQERALIAFAYNKKLPVSALWDYIEQGCANYAQDGSVTGYSSQVTDLFDAVCLGLWDTGRFRV